MKSSLKEFLKKINFNDPSEYDFDADSSIDANIKETIKKNFRGFPDYLVYIDGKPVNKEISGRTVEDLKKFSGM